MAAKKAKKQNKKIESQDAIALFRGAVRLFILLPAPEEIGDSTEARNFCLASGRGRGGNGLGVVGAEYDAGDSTASRRHGGLFHNFDFSANVQRI